MKNNSAFLQTAQHRNIRSKGRSRLRFYAAVVLSAFLLTQNISVLTLHALAEEIPAAETPDPAIPGTEAAIMEAPVPETLNPAIPDPADSSLPASLLPGDTAAAPDTAPADNNSAQAAGSDTLNSATSDSSTIPAAGGVSSNSPPDDTSTMPAACSDTLNSAPADSSTVPAAGGVSSNSAPADSGSASGSITIRNEVYSLDDFAEQQATPGTGTETGSSSGSSSAGKPAAPDLSVDLSVTADNAEDRNAIDSSLEKQIAGQEGDSSGAVISMDEEDPDLCHLTLPAGESFTLDELPPDAQINLGSATSSDPEHFETNLTASARGDGETDAEGEDSGDPSASAQEKRTYTFTQTQKDHDRIVLICSAEPPAGQPEDASQGASPVSGQGQTAGDGSAGGSSASGPDFEYTVTTADGSSFTYQTDHPDYKSGSAQNGTATFLLRNGQKALISQMTDGLIDIVQKAHEAYHAAAAALLNKSAAENVSIPEHDEDAAETAIDINCAPGASTPYIRFTNTERKENPEEDKPNPETDKADPEKETEPPQTEEPVKETEPPQTEEPVKETEPPQTEEPVKETEPPQTETPEKETEPPQTEVPTKETEPPQIRIPEKEPQLPQTEPPLAESPVNPQQPRTEAPGKAPSAPKKKEVILTAIPSESEPPQSSPAPETKTGSPVSVQEKPEQPHPAESSQNQSPETGDNTPLSFWIILLLLSSAGVFVAAYRIRRIKKGN